MGPKSLSFVIVFSTVISGLLAFIVICFPVIVSAFTAYTVPTEVKEWGGIIVGFYFGSFATLIIESIKRPKEAPSGNGG